MSRIEEGTCRLDDGFSVYTKRWRTPLSQPAIARLLFVHGFSDHCNNYDDLIPYLAGRGIEVHAFDQRGWGRSVPSQSHRGLTGPTTQVMADITCMLKTLVNDTTATTPIFLMGHSMGGGEVLYYTATGPRDIVSRIRGVIASGPLIALHPTVKPWRTTVAAGRIAGKLLPHFHLVQKLPKELQSHDSERNQAWADDELCHDTGTLEGLAGMLDRTRSLECGEQMTLQDGLHEGGVTRLLVVHGESDEINSLKASEEYVARAKVVDKEMCVQPGMKHCMHIGPGNDKFREKVASWILDRVDGSDRPQDTPVVAKM